MRTLALISFGVLVSYHFVAAQVDQDDAQVLKDTNTIAFRTRNSLMIVPVLINDTIRVMLAIDPHCSSVVLFGKKYQRMLEETSVVTGNQQRVAGQIMRNNSIEIGPVVNQNVSIVVVGNSNPLNFFTGVNGVIGSHFFENYSLEVDHRKQTLTFKPPTNRYARVHASVLQKSTSAIDLFSFD